MTLEEIEAIYVDLYTYHDLSTASSQAQLQNLMRAMADIAPTMIDGQKIEFLRLLKSMKEDILD